MATLPKVAAPLSCCGLPASMQQSLLTPIAVSQGWAVERVKALWPWAGPSRGLTLHNTCSYYYQCVPACVVDTGAQQCYILPLNDAAHSHSSEDTVTHATTNFKDTLICITSKGFGIFPAEQVHLYCCNSLAWRPGSPFICAGHAV